MFAIINTEKFIHIKDGILSFMNRRIYTLVVSNGKKLQC